MELIEILVLIGLGGNAILFVFCVYLMAKVSFLETVVKGLKKPEQIFKELMKNKIPILRDASGQLILPDQHTPPTPPPRHNPITG